MKRKELWQLMKDVQRVEEFKMSAILSNMPEADGRVSSNVGEMISAALMAVGAVPAVIGGSAPCETDYLAASGAVFPEVSIEEMESFNQATLFANMSEDDEQRRYIAIAKFFHRG